MEKSTQLTQRFRDVILEGKWIANTNYKDILDTISWQESTLKIGGLNTIAALTFHVNYYIEGIVHVFEGGKLDIRDKYSFDLPPIDSTAKWVELRNGLYRNAEKLAVHIEQFSDEKLATPFVDEKYGDYRRNIEGLIEHSYYHLGQLTLLKKLIKKG